MTEHSHCTRLVLLGTRRICHTFSRQFELVLIEVSKKAVGAAGVAQSITPAPRASLSPSLPLPNSRFQRGPRNLITFYHYFYLHKGRKFMVAWNTDALSGWATIGVLRCDTRRFYRDKKS